MDSILKYLSDNYIYVSGAGLIIIIILIGFLASKRKGRKEKKGEEKETMVNINDVQTGGLGQVVDNLKKEEVKPVEVTTPVQNPSFVAKEPVIPLVNEAKPVEPTLSTTTPPILSSVKSDDRFEKTEVMDFSDVNGYKQELKKENSSSVNSFAPGSSQYTNDSILNGEETNNPNKPLQ
jgi:hypothetical protein